MGSTPMSPSSRNGTSPAVRFDWSPTLRTLAVPTARPLPASISHDHGFRADIEGLRAVAVVLVLLYHFDLLGVSGGYVGVDVFFVISGFLITRLLVRDVETGGSLGGLLATFYARRFRRLLPLATVVLLATVWAAHQWLGFLRGNATARDAGWAAAFLANVHFGRIGTDYLGAQSLPSPLQHFWSLAVEEQFYVVWPLVVAAAMRWGRPDRRLGRLRVVFATVVAASFAWCVVQTSSNGTWAYFSPLTRAWELALGAFVAVWAVEMRRVPRPVLRWVGAMALVVVIASAIRFDAATRFPGTAALIPVGATALVIAAGSGRGTALCVLRWRPLQRIGALSYSLYLWHWPVLVVLDGRSESPLSLGGRLAGLGLSLLLSITTYRLVENPIRSSKLLARRRGLSLAFGAALVAVSLVAVRTQQDRSAPNVAPAAPAATATNTTTVITAPVGSAPPTSAAAATTPGTPTETTGAALPGPTLVSAVEVAAAVAAAATIDALPADLRPTLEAAPTDFEDLDATGCSDTDRDPTAGRCPYGATDADRLVVLFGDSHAGMWLTAAHLAAEQAGWQLRMFSRAGCPAPTISFYDRTDRRMNTECDEARTASIDSIRTLAPEVIVVTSASLAQSVSPDEVATAEMWQTGMTETLRRLSAPGTRLVVLGDMPVLASTNPECLAVHPTDIQQCGSTRAEALDGVHVEAERAAAAAAGADFIDVTDWFCTDRCSPVIASRQVYRNRFHVTAAFAEFVAGALAEELALGSGG